VTTQHFFLAEPTQGAEPVQAVVRPSICHGLSNFSDGLQFQKEPTWQQMIGGSLRKSVPFQIWTNCQQHAISEYTTPLFGQQAAFGKGGLGGSAFHELVFQKDEKPSCGFTRNFSALSYPALIKTSTIKTAC